MHDTGVTARPVSWDLHRTGAWRRSERFSFAEAARSVPVTMRETISTAYRFVRGVVPKVLHTDLRRPPSGQSVFIGRNGPWQEAARLFALVDVTSCQTLALNAKKARENPAPNRSPVFADWRALCLSPAAGLKSVLAKPPVGGLPSKYTRATSLRISGLLSWRDRWEMMWCDAGTSVRRRSS